MIPIRKNTVPVTVARCPVHHQLVGFDGEGNLLGRCGSCAAEAAQALIHLEQRVLDRIARLP